MRERRQAHSPRRRELPRLPASARPGTARRSEGPKLASKAPTIRIAAKIPKAAEFIAAPGNGPSRTSARFTSQGGSNHRFDRSGVLDQVVFRRAGGCDDVAKNRPKLGEELAGAHDLEFGQRCTPPTLWLAPWPCALRPAPAEPRQIPSHLLIAHQHVLCGQPKLALWIDRVFPKAGVPAIDGKSKQPGSPSQISSQT